MYLFKNLKEVHDPFYQQTFSIYPWEYELLQTKTLKRLKYLSHYGTGSLITSVKHSRFEHTIGVWTIISTFFPKEEELRIAALLHDIGHLPFSHAVEHPLGLNHHTITEEYIRGEEVARILRKYDFLPEKIIDLLNQDTPLSHKTAYLSADHLDSFLRDAYMLGRLDRRPAQMIQSIYFEDKYVEADLTTSREIMSALYHDHCSFLHPTLLALDYLLSKAISIYATEKAQTTEVIKTLTNNELIHLLVHSRIESVEEIMSIVMWEPERIMVHDHLVDGAETIEVRKVYDKSPLVDGEKLTSICADSHKLLEEIRSLKKVYYISY
ncbi:HD domain-containing protein [Aquibacillus koreensis]|uniref:HD domain-containing protein n=1 Tax=Aquibacillus koreensis TaxID=279446 RepID=A0A9X4AKS7_9BACI|nr:HD domain-containing protein [Aquibacillus koreensis]MCT2534428.1 HD domain-containing protein [Aquibacillus koreensis]MDC3421735.1 HD domain-containing protein [Aquibacillus koreensis]